MSAYFDTHHTAGFHLGRNSPHPPVALRVIPVGGASPLPYLTLPGHVDDSASCSKDNSFRRSCRQNFNIGRPRRCLRTGSLRWPLGSVSSSAKSPISASCPRISTGVNHDFDARRTARRDRQLSESSPGCFPCLWRLNDESTQTFGPANATTLPCLDKLRHASLVHSGRIRRRHRGPTRRPAQSGGPPHRRG